jgi:hypothetical protein
MLAAWIAEKGMIGIGSTPPFAIGQRALLVRTDDGNILWDCIATLDDATVTMIEGLGGIASYAVAVTFKAAPCCIEPAG